MQYGILIVFSKNNENTVDRLLIWCKSMVRSTIIVIIKCYLHTEVSVLNLLRYHAMFLYGNIFKLWSTMDQALNWFTFAMNAALK